MRTTITSLAVLAILALPGAAAAQATGGNAGTDEYTETIPGGGGNNPSNNNDGGSGSGDPSGSGPLTPSQVAALEAQGADGAAAADLVQATGPDRKAKAGGPGAGGEGSAGSGEAPASDSGGSGVTEVIGDLAGGDDSGMGIALPLILVAALIGAVAFVAVRRGGSHTDQA